MPKEVRMSKSSTSKPSSAASKKTTAANAPATKATAPKVTESKQPVAAKTPAKEAVAPKAETKATTTKAAVQAPQETITKTQPVPAPATNKIETVITLDTENIAQHAYFLWQQEGYQHGKDREYWLRAEDQLKKQLATARK